MGIAAKRTVATLGALVLALSVAGCAAEPAVTPTTAESSSPEADSTVQRPVTDGTPITLTSGDTVITAILNDSQASEDFIATLPATLPWFRNYGIEYITEFDAPLTEDGPFYTDVQPGDLVYYNPMDSITIIYEETSSVPTLTFMGQITSDLAEFRSLPDDVVFDVALAD
jgi:hypothetical protein